MIETVVRTRKGREVYGQKNEGGRTGNAKRDP